MTIDIAQVFKFDKEMFERKILFPIILVKKRTVDIFSAGPHTSARAGDKTGLPVCLAESEQGAALLMVTGETL